MKIVNDEHKYRSFIELYKKCVKVIVYPIFIDPFRHPCVNEISLLYVFLIDEGEEFVLAVNHPETGNISIDGLFDDQHLYLTYDKKNLLKTLPAVNFVDMRLIPYLSKSDAGESPLWAPVYEFSQRTGKHGSYNKYVPIAKHIEFCLEIRDEIISAMFDNDVDVETFKFYQMALNEFSKMEANGIYVDRQLFNNMYPGKHIDENFLYTDYNFYTKTGRPSNTFDNVNFAALNKSDATRLMFRSRYENGYLITFDYDAFHLALIGELIGYEMPQENFHSYLARQYGVSYDESKKKSFQYLYGNIPPKIADEIPYFNMVDKFSKSLWRDINKNGYITSVSGRKIFLDHIEEPNANKVFNYLIQLAETESNIPKIAKLNELLQEYETKLVLYTYDSFTFDFSPEDGSELLFEIKDILEDGKFHTSIQAGHDYKNVVDITDKFKKV